jgi:hypothetical protein
LFFIRTFLVSGNQAKIFAFFENKILQTALTENLLSWSRFAYIMTHKKRVHKKAKKFGWSSWKKSNNRGDQANFRLKEMWNYSVPPCITFGTFAFKDFSAANWFLIYKSKSQAVIKKSRGNYLDVGVEVFHDIRIVSQLWNSIVFYVGFVQRPKIG